MKGNELPKSLPAWSLPILVAVVAFILLVLTGLPSYGVDSFGYAISIKHGTQLLHPHHLGYNWLNHWLWKSAKQLGWEMEAMDFAIWINRVLAAICITFVHGFFRNIGIGRGRALGLSLGLLLCFGFWRMANMVEVYMGGMCSLAALLWALSRSWKRKWLWSACIILLWTISICFHQTNVLFFVPLALILWKNDKLALAIITSSSAALVLGIYWLSASASGYGNDLDGLFNFMFSYHLKGQDGWGTFSNLGPLGWMAMLKGQLSNLIGRYSVVFLFQLIFGLGLLALLLQGIVMARRIEKSEKWRPWVLAMLAWMGAHLLFFGWWLPQEGEFFLVSLLPLLALLAMAIERSQSVQRLKRGIWMAVILLGSTQFVLQIKYIYFEEHADAAMRAQAAALVAALPKDCQLLEDHQVVGWAEYLDDRKGEDYKLLFYHYLGSELNTFFLHFGQHASIAIPVEALDPSKQYKGKSGNAEPNGYLAFWRIAAQANTVSDSVSALALRLETIGTKTYLTMGPERKIYLDEYAILKEFAGLLGEGPVAQHLDEWIKANAAARQDSL